MIMRKLFYFVMTGIVLLGCNGLEISPDNEVYFINAEVEADMTRTSVTDEGHFTWSVSDKIWLETTVSSVTGTLSAGAGTADATFVYESHVGTLTGNSVYPYNDGHYVSGNTLNVVLPSEYDLGSSLDNSNVAMYGVQVGEDIRFRHLAGAMRFSFRNVPSGVNKFKLTLDKKINGTFEADMTEFYPILYAGESVDETDRTITLNFDALTVVSDIKLYVPLPTGTYESLAWSLWDDDEPVEEYSNTVTNIVDRKSLLLMPDYTLSGSLNGNIENENPYITVGNGQQHIALMLPQSGYGSTGAKLNTNLDINDLECYMQDEASWLNVIIQPNYDIIVNCTGEPNNTGSQRSATVYIRSKYDPSVFAVLIVNQL